MNSEVRPPESPFDHTPFAIDEAQNVRLAARHTNIVARHGDCFAGRRVLDLASHDGRWSWAALNAGAGHVTGVEGRASLVDKSHRNFGELSIDPSRYEFVCSDVFEYLSSARREAKRWDTILCLGLFYHVMDHYRLLQLMTEAATGHVILDTGLVDSSDTFIRLTTDNPANDLHAISQTEGQETAVVGFVSHGALRLMAESLGWTLEFVEWRECDFSRFAPLALYDYFNRGEGNHRRYTAVLAPKG